MGRGPVSGKTVSDGFMNLNKDLYPFNGYAYRAVAVGRNPLGLSFGLSRAIEANTAGLYCADKPETCVREVAKYISNPEIFIIKVSRLILVLDLISYCAAEGMPKEDCYAGEWSPNKKIHLFFGQKIEAMSWESDKNPGGISMVFLTQNILNYELVFKAEKI